LPILEQYKRFGRSRLWQFQEEAYGRFGPDAWRRAGVPFYLTSNPYTADQYCETAIGYLRDILRNGAVDPSSPVTFFDLGAGSGRFSYLFWKRLLPRARALFGPELKLRLILTDCVEENRRFWKRHPRLLPFIEEGSLDIAAYHHGREAPLELEISGERIETVENPAVLIANYFFDTLPQDLFRIRGGRLEEGQLELSGEGEAAIESFQFHYRYVPITEPARYFSDFPELNRLLLEYLKLYRERTFLLPTGGLEALRYFSKMAGGRFLLLAGDQGVQEGGGEPKIAKHGTFSVAVDYRALQLYYSLTGGEGHLAAAADPTFVVTAAAAGEGEHPETEAAFYRTLGNFGPVDYWRLGEEAFQNLDRCSLERLLLLLQLGKWDPMNFHAFFPKIFSLLERASEKERGKLLSFLDFIYQEFYPIADEEKIFLQNLGAAAFKLGDRGRAFQFLEEARKMQKLTGR